MSGIDWLVAIGVVAIATCIVYLVRRARNAKSTKLKTQPPMKAVSQELESEKEQLDVGRGEVSDKGLEDAEPIAEEVSSTSTSSAPTDKWIWQDMTAQAPSTAEPDKLHAPRKAVPPSERGEVPPKSHVHFDWQKHFEDSIKSPFPEEWSPASRFLHEAYQLEKEGAVQAKIDQALRKAREADPKATDFYISRQSIIKKRKRK